MEIIDNYYRVLDKGFIALKDVMGDDYAIEQAARVSYGAGTRKSNETRGLIRYLMRHAHTTPFEMCELKFHVKVPMDCWRQWIRHRTANVNEYSTRYSLAIDESQSTLPDKWRLQSKNNKQGSSGYLDFDEGIELSKKEETLHINSRTVYHERISKGVAREQARKDLPLSTYTEAYWKIDLHNLFHFLKLRCDNHAQEEIRSYAYVMASIVKEIFPIAFEAWYDYSFLGCKFSRLDMQLMYHMDEYSDISEDLARHTLNMSSREISEFWTKMNMIKNMPDYEQVFNISNYEVLENYSGKEDNVGQPAL